MGIGAVSLTIVLYNITAFCCIKQKDYPHALMWFSYALANTGLLWYEIVKEKVS